MHDLLDDCKKYGIPTALLLMPEHSACRGWYSPPSRELVRRHLGQVAREYQLPVIDMRDWLTDEDFADYCHMVRWAAAPFSRRLGREVLQPWLEGKPLPQGVLLREDGPATAH